ncbi:MAG: hypothetical protein E7607_02970 [Ruminococcaceae bacterium]|nr:hypothetical protein [Oscillospiraceae bacterium]
MKEENKRRQRPDDEKIPDVDIRINPNESVSGNKAPQKEHGNFYKWLDNFWYHYKWHTIIITFLVIVVTVCTVQSLRTTKYDMKILYAGSKQLEGQEVADLEEMLGGFVPEDTNDDGHVALALNRYYVLSEEQIKEGNKNYDANRNTNEYSNFLSYLQTGDASIMLLEKWIYDSIPKESLCKLSELFGDSLPEGAIDDCGVRLGDTEIYKVYPAMQKLPADTVICLQVPLYHEKKLKKSTQMLYEIEKSTFIALLTYPLVES